MQSDDLGVREFSLLHAQNILQLQERERIPAKDCWGLVGNTYQFIGNELVKRRNSKADKTASTQEGAEQVG